MNLFTLQGRLQTKVLILLLVACITCIFAAVGGARYWQLYGLAAATGLALETIWGFIVEYQPGYLTWLMGVIEFLAISVLAILFHLPLSLGEAAAYYIITWSLMQLFLIYILPVLRPSWGDFGGLLVYLPPKKPTTT
jgi:hypothetical protein